MDQKMYITELVKISQDHELEKITELSFMDQYTPFEGYPRKHPLDKSKFLLFSDPFSATAPFYEFPVSTIGRIEEIETVSSPDGKSGIQARVWIRKGTSGIMSRQLIVG